MEHNVGQDPDVTASQIVQRAIDSYGSETKLDSLHSVEFFTQLITPENEILYTVLAESPLGKRIVNYYDKKPDDP
ncbi:MAG: hypothetical protein JNK79_02650 [Chitinophagaceae bacterium]|nr:hypothetical protein [Chitinophagaceae bacterium]